MIGVKEFLKAGENVDAVSRDGNYMTALRHALAAPRDYSIESAQLFAEAGADADVRLGGVIRYTALMCAAKMHSPLVMQKANPRWIGLECKTIRP